MATPKSKGRMLNKDLSDSKGFAALSPPAAVLFLMLVPHYSPYGKLNGSPEYIKGEICPRVPYLKTGNIANYLEEITEHTSVKWFEHDGRKWIHSLKFLIEHQNLRNDRVGPDLMPSYPGPLQDNSRSSAGEVPPEVEVEVEVEVEEEGDRTRSPAAPLPSKKLTPSNGKFQIPTVEEVAEYCRKRGKGVNPLRFHAYYTSIGWKVGKNPMKNWKAAIVSTWEKGEL